MRIREIVAFALVLGMVGSGCKDSASEPEAGGTPIVQLTAAASGGGGSVYIAKVSFSGGSRSAIDSLRVRGALIVLKDIVFKAAIDTVKVRDSVETERWYKLEDAFGGIHGRGKDSSRVHFKGPFIVALQDTTPVQVALDTIPPGTYNGIRFHIHKLKSKDVQQNPSLPDTLVGYSIVVTGSVRDTAGTWTDFVYKSDINEEFKAKGDFVVAPGDKLVPYVLKFDIASWFKAPDGRIFDPNDSHDQRSIRHAIKASLHGGIRCGRDRNYDGDPD